MSAVTCQEIFGDACHLSWDVMRCWSAGLGPKMFGDGSLLSSVRVCFGCLSAVTCNLMFWDAGQLSSVRRCLDMPYSSTLVRYVLGCMLAWNCNEVFQYLMSSFRRLLNMCFSCHLQGDVVRCQLAVNSQEMFSDAYEPSFVQRCLISLSAVND